jgi:hypothetical protein
VFFNRTIHLPLIYRGTQVLQLKRLFTTGGQPSRATLLQHTTMADFETEIEQNMGDEILADIDMVGAEANTSTAVMNGTNAERGGNGLPFQEDEEDEYVSMRIPFVDHLKSPTVELLIGEDEKQTLLTAHQALLVQSPFFEDACTQFGDSAKVWQTQILYFVCNRLLIFA